MAVSDDKLIFDIPNDFKEQIFDIPNDFKEHYKYIVGPGGIRIHNDIGEIEGYTYSSLKWYDVGNLNRSGYSSGYITDFDNSTCVLNFNYVNISSFERRNNYVSFNMDNGTSFQVQTNSSTDDIFKYTADGKNISYAKIGLTDVNNSFTYSDGVNFIGSANHEDTLQLSTYDSIYLNDGSRYLNIDNIDARNSSSSYYQRNLFGNTGNNKIYGGSNDVLWGGDSGNDELYGCGTGGNNTYRFGANEGSTTIYNSTAQEHVDLYNVSLSQISNAYEQGSDLVVDMYNGDSLRIVGQDGASNFRLSDNSEYYYARDTHTWHAK